MVVGCRYCTSSTPYCADGVLLYRKAIALGEIVLAKGFVYLPQDIRDRIYQQYEEWKKNYFNHVGQ